MSSFVIYLHGCRHGPKYSPYEQDTCVRGSKYGFDILLVHYPTGCPSIYLVWPTGCSFGFKPSPCFSSRATKKPCVRVLVVLARRHWVSGSKPRSGHWGSRGTNLGMETTCSGDSWIQTGFLSPTVCVQGRRDYGQSSNQPDIQLRMGRVCKTISSKEGCEQSMWSH